MVAMSLAPTPSPRSTPSERGIRLALIFALAAEQLSAFYQHGQWLTEAQTTSQAADWLLRSKRSLPLAERKVLARLADQLARQVPESVSRETGLYIAHEMMEALDPNHQSEISQTLMSECERLLDSLGDSA